MARVLILCLAVLTACTRADPETDPKVDLGDFQLGHNVVITKNARKSGPTRAASPEEWEVKLESAIAQRFGSYNGGKLYHLGINLDGYALAVPGVPVVLSPKSAMVISINVWDDAAGKKLNDKPRQVTVFEQLDSDTVIGSGLTQTREEQMDKLSRNMARSVERYLINNAQWFGGTGEPQAAGALDVGAQEAGDFVPPQVPAGAGSIETTALPNTATGPQPPITAGQATGLTRPIQRPAN